MSSNYLATQSHLLGNGKVDFGTQTNIWGTDQELIETAQNRNGLEIPVFEKEIQCSFEKSETIEKEVATSNKRPIE